MAFHVVPAIPPLMFILLSFLMIHFFYFVYIGDVSDQYLVCAEYAAKIRGEHEAGKGAEGREIIILERLFRF